MLKERIPEAYDAFLAGFDLARKPPNNVFCLHHPSGDVKKFSSYAGTCRAVSWTEAPSQYHWEVPLWDKGITEPGSSGSPLFTQRGLLVGHLHGGQSSCDYPQGYDVFGGVVFDWATGPSVGTRLREALNPKGFKLDYVDGVALNDARNSTGIDAEEDGSVFQQCLPSKSIFTRLWSFVRTLLLLPTAAITVSDGTQFSD